MPRSPEEKAPDTMGESPGAANSKFNPAPWLLVMTLASITALLFIWWNPPGGDSAAETTIPGDGLYGPDQGALELAPSEDSMKRELIRVVDSQLSAFRKNDYLKAYTYAAAGIRAHFSPTAFERMVKMGYPPIAQSLSADFGTTLDNGLQAVVNVGIIAGSGKALYYYQYHLQREKTGWKISGVAPIRLKGALARVQVPALAG
jgi:hypothetical protein